MTDAHKPGNLKGTKTIALLIDRGEIQFTYVDIDAAFRVWRTNIFFNASVSTVLQGIINEFYRIIHAWNSAGGGTFSTADTDNMNTIDDMVLRNAKGSQGDRAADIDLTLRSFYEEVST